MKFRNNQVLGFGKFLVDMERLTFFFFIKGKDPKKLSSVPKFKCCGDSSKGIRGWGSVWNHVTFCRGMYTFIHT